MRRCYTQNFKALGLALSEKKIFKDFFSKIYFSLPDPDFQLIRTIWTFLEELHAWKIPGKFLSNLAQWFLRRRCLYTSWRRMQGRINGRWTPDILWSQKPALSTLCSGEIKKHLSLRVKMNFNEIIEYKINCSVCMRSLNLASYPQTFTVSHNK